MGPGPGPGRGQGQGPGPGPLGTGCVDFFEFELFINKSISCQEIDRRLKQNTTFLIKVSTLLGVYSDYPQKVGVWLEVFVKSSNFTRCF